MVQEKGSRNAPALMGACSAHARDPAWQQANWKTAAVTGTNGTPKHAQVVRVVKHARACSAGGGAADRCVCAGWGVTGVCVERSSHRRTRYGRVTAAAVTAPACSAAPPPLALRTFCTHFTAWLIAKRALPSSL